MMKIVYTIPMIALLVSCGREDVETYQVPKEQKAAPEMQAQTPVERSAPVASPSAPQSSAGFTAELPEGWKEVSSSSAMRKVSYGIEGTDIDFYLISLSMGDVPSNVNRWRGQVGLPNATPAEIEKDLQIFTAGGHEVKFIEIYNEEGGKGIVAAIIDLAPSYWYFTGKGTVQELKAHASDMRTYLESIKFEGHNH
ncbi:hypothetical protein P4B35_22835 [Pontiellaceae bacterium B12227]|nr:hypothetical protein [Pontiellaceae bacterium B12227]